MPYAWFVTCARGLSFQGSSENFNSAFEAELADHIPVVKCAIAGTRVVGRCTVGKRRNSTKRRPIVVPRCFTTASSCSLRVFNLSQTKTYWNAHLRGCVGVSAAAWAGLCVGTCGLLLQGTGAGCWCPTRARTWSCSTCATRCRTASSFSASKSACLRSGASDLSARARASESDRGKAMGMACWF